MSEAWRRKTYYKPRVLIDVQRVINPQFADGVICITGAELEMLRNLMQYLHRRSTFADAYYDDHYSIASNDDWDSLQAIVACLEEKLMGCEEFLLLLEGILAQVTCVCQKTTIVADVLGTLPVYGPSLQPVVDAYLTDGRAQVDDNYGGETPLSAVRCAIAQLTYAMAYEFTTEVLHPAAAEAVDVLLPLVMVALAVMCGTSVLGIPIGVLLATLWSLIKINVEGSMQDVQNAILANKEDLVCALWRGFMFGYGTAQANASEVIGEMAGLSVLDKVALRLLFTPFVMMLAAKANANSTSWAIANIAAGFCVDCDEIEGVDWWAQVLEPSTNTVTISLPTGGLDGGCWQGNFPAGEAWCGVVYRVQAMTGPDTHLKCMSNAETGCDGYSLWGDTSAHVPNGLYFAVDGLNIDEVDCKSVLAAGAADWPGVSRRQNGEEAGAGFFFQASGTASVEIVFLYLVYEGEPP